MSEFCEFCDKELSEEKGELAHGCLTCHYAPWVDKIKSLQSKIEQLEKKCGEYEEALIIYRSFCLDDLHCQFLDGVPTDKTAREVLEKWREK